MDKTDHYYQKAIDILMQDNDWKLLCVSVAKLDPKLFCEAHGKAPWQIVAVNIFHSEGKVASIKYIRNETGYGLKEAKEAIENLVGNDD